MLTSPLHSSFLQTFPHSRQETALAVFQVASVQPLAADVATKHPLHIAAAVADAVKLWVAVGRMCPLDGNLVHYVVVGYHMMLEAFGIAVV